MRHAEEVFQEHWFHASPWLLCGTGPSLNLADNRLRKEFNILTINGASSRLKADVAFQLDQTSILEYLTSGETHRYIVTRTNNEFNAHPTQKTNILYIAIDNNSMPDHFRPYFTYSPKPSSAQAIEYLARGGVKEVYTIGIDGGNDMAEIKHYSDNLYHETHKESFTDKNQFLFSTAQKYNLNIRKYL